MSPCFQRDHWGRVAYMVDGFENPFEQRVEIEDSITFRLAVSSPDEQFAQEAHTKLGGRPKYRCACST